MWLRKKDRDGLSASFAIHIFTFPTPLNATIAIQFLVTWSQNPWNETDLEKLYLLGLLRSPTHRGPAWTSTPAAVEGVAECRCDRPSPFYSFFLRLVGNPGCWLGEINGGGRSSNSSPWSGGERVNRNNPHRFRNRNGPPPARFRFVSSVWGTGNHRLRNRG